jgi:A/G-specific adenine glycosylase
MQLTPPKILTYQNKILLRREENARDFPWRSTHVDPYHVLVSEMMLQQTQAERVVPKFLNFLDEVPTLQHLADLERKDLLRLWSGLGFNSRAMRLQQTAQIVVDKYNSLIPQSRELLMAFPGIGAYSSASIPAFAYNLPEPVVDTNIRRVMIHEL